MHAGWLKIFISLVTEIDGMMQYRQGCTGLQASWLKKSVCQFIKEKWLQSDHIRMLGLSLRLAENGLRDSAVRSIAADWKYEELFQMFAQTVDNSSYEQCEILAILANFADIRQVIPSPVSLPTKSIFQQMPVVLSEKRKVGT